MRLSFLKPRNIPLIVCSLLVATFIFFAETTPGLRILFRYANPVLVANGITIEPQAVHGRLSMITLDELNYKEKITINAHDITIDWDPLSIVFQQVFIRKLTANSLNIGLFETEAASASINQPSSKKPFKIPAIRTDRLEVKRFALNSPQHDEIIEHQNVSGDATITNEEIYFNHLQSDFLGFKTKLFGSISLRENSSIELKGQLSQNTKLGNLDLNLLLLLLPNHILTIKGDGMITSGQTKIPIAYELAEKNNQFGLLAWDARNSNNSQFFMEISLPAKRSENWDAKLKVNSVDLTHAIPYFSSLVDLDLVASGNMASQSVDLHLRNQKSAALFAKITRTKENAEWNTSIEDISFDYPAEHWTLENPPHPVSVINQLYEIKNLCLVNQLSRVCGDGSYYPPAQFKMKVTSDHFDNQTLNLFLDPIKIFGTSQFEFGFERLLVNPKANLSIVSNDAAIQLDDKKIQFNHAEIKATHADQRSQINIDVLTSKNDTGTIALVVANQEKKSPSIQGSIDLNLKELNPFNLYLNNFYEIQGSIEAKIKLDGTLDQPIYQGSLMIGDSQARIPQLGLTLSHIDLSLAGEGDHQIRIKGGAQSNGPITLNALISLSRQEMSSEVEIIAEHIKMMDLPPAQATGSFHFKLTQLNNKTKLDGTLHLEQGKFDGRMLQRRFGNNTDIVFINSARKTPELNYFHTDYTVKLIVDNAIQFTGFDVITHIGGEVDIKSRTQGSPLGSGELHLINGSYDNYNKHFMIEKGSLVYNQSTLDNPALDVTAIYDLQDPNFTEDGFDKLEITIQALGSLMQPKLLLSSKPALSQEDILSYLVLGTPISQAGDNNSAPLSQAALAFALKGGSQNVLNNVRKSLGLSQLSLGAITPASGVSTMNPTGEDRGFQDNTAIFVGKTVSPNLYVSYGVGLFNAQQTFRTRLKLGRRWQLITESSNVENSADFVYVIERGGN